MRESCYDCSVFLLFLILSVSLICQDREGTIDCFFPENFQIREVNYSTSITLKILLVEFADIKHRALPSAYTEKDFENLFFSENIYVSPNMYSPDGKEVWGSLRDYYSIMSNGKLNIRGKILNHNSTPEGSSELQWIKLDSNKFYYHNYRGGVFRVEAKTKAQNLGLDISTNDSTFLVIIYAGHTYRAPAGEAANTLNPQAYYSQHEYIMGERFASYSPYESERPDAHFAHIGIHSHEFAHLLGIPDYNNKRFDLMSGGEYNGPERECACPAPINPIHRKSLGWLNYNEISSDTIISPTYSLKTSQLYKIRDKNIGANYFIIEFRKFNGFMSLGGNITSDYNSHITNLTCDRGILVWRVAFNTVVGLIYADGKNDENYDGHIFPGNHNVKVISPWSDSRIPYDGHLWYPTTKPSNNCGMEIISENDENYTLKLYSQNPLNAPPSKPREFYVNRTKPDEVTLNWEANFEPDIITNGYYKIYKCESSDNNPTSFEYLTTVDAYIDGNPVTSWKDYETNSGILNNKFYRITAVDNSNKESVPSEYDWTTQNNQTRNIDVLSEEPLKNYLLQNYPNPFNPSTIISYNIPSNSYIKLELFSVTGEKLVTLVNSLKEAGYYNQELKADELGLSSGTYFYRLIAIDNSSGKEFVETKKLLLMK